MIGVGEDQRRRIAGALLILGVGLILVGVWMIVFRQPAYRTPIPVKPVATNPALLERVLFITILLILTFIVSVLAFLRWSRHFRRFILRRPAEPTPVTDVWQMHRLPDDEDLDGPAELPDGPPKSS